MTPRFFYANLTPSPDNYLKNGLSIVNDSSKAGVDSGPQATGRYIVADTLGLNPAGDQRAIAVHFV